MVLFCSYCYANNDTDTHGTVEESMWFPSVKFMGQGKAEPRNPTRESYYFLILYCRVLYFNER